MPYYRDLETGRFVSESHYERAVSENADERFRVEFGKAELAAIAEQTPAAEDYFPDYDDYIDVEYEAPEEDEY